MKRTLLLLTLVLLGGCRKDGKVSARVLGGDATGIDFELIGPPDTQFEVGHQQFVGPGRVHVASPEFGPTRTDKCFRAEASSLPSKTRACVELPYTMKQLLAFPARGQFGVLSTSQTNATLELSFVFAGPKTVRVAKQEVALDAFGTGHVQLDLRDAFAAAARPDPASWRQPLAVELEADGQSRLVEVPFDGTPLVQTWLSGPQPTGVSEGLLAVLQRPAGSTVKYERVSGAATFPRYVMSETHTSRKGGLCFGRPSELVDRTVTVRDLREDKVVATKTFKAQLLDCSGIFDMNYRPHLYYGFVDDQALLAWARAEALSHLLP